MLNIDTDYEAKAKKGRSQTDNYYSCTRGNNTIRISIASSV